MAKCVSTLSPGCYRNVEQDAIDFANHVETTYNNPILVGSCKTCQTSYLLRRKLASSQVKARISGAAARQKACERISMTQALEEDKQRMAEIITGIEVSTKLEIKLITIRAMANNGVLEKVEGPSHRVIYVTRSSVCTFIEKFLSGDANLRYLTRKEVNVLEQKKEELLEKLSCGALI